MDLININGSYMVPRVNTGNCPVRLGINVLGIVGFPHGFDAVEISLCLKRLNTFPSGEPTCCYGKSPFLMGKSTISMAIFNCYVSSPEGTPHGILVDSPCNFADAVFQVTSTSLNLFLQNYCAVTISINSYVLRVICLNSQSKKMQVNLLYLEPKSHGSPPIHSKSALFPSKW